MHAWAVSGEQVLVVTVMTADPPADAQSDFARQLHESWGYPALEAYEARRREEAEALARLGVEHRHLGLLDCIYRGDDSGWYYVSDDDLFGDVHPSDTAVETALVSQLEAVERDFAPNRIYAPLGAGHHVDHQLVRDAAAALWGEQLLLYEDLPYASVSDSVCRARHKAFPDRPPLKYVRELSAADMLAKVAAVGQYRSQLGVLFLAHVAMAAVLWQHARRTSTIGGWAERYWFV
jgi:LmbE family N-acetylglucosaminyl deacetylase